jgi:hypothetical protein
VQQVETVASCAGERTPWSGTSDVDGARRVLAVVSTVRGAGCRSSRTFGLCGLSHCDGVRSGPAALLDDGAVCAASAAGRTYRSSGERIHNDIAALQLSISTTPLSGSGTTDSF